mgnify:CR=1 FL=1
MPTRFYYPGSAIPAPPATPAYSSAWEKTSDAARRYLSVSKLNTVSAAYTEVYENVSSAPYDVLIRQYISDRLAAQTISGTVKGQARWYESNAAADFCVALVIKVVSGDGSTVRGTLLEYFPSSLASEFATTATNRYTPPETALNPVQAQEGDRIVIEIGLRSFNTVTTTYYGRFYTNDTSSIDLPEDETTTSDYASWIEFSADIDFIDQITVSQVCAQVEYQDPPKLNVFQYIAQVEYVPTPPGQFNVDVSVSVELSPSGTITTIEFSKDADASVALDPAGTTTIFQAAGEFVTDIEVNIDLSPNPVSIWDRVCSPAVNIALLADVDVFIPVRFVNADCTVELLPGAVSRMPTPGWDPESGYGVVDFSWLEEDPPFYVLFGNISLVVDPTASQVYLYAEDQYAINPALKVGGRATVTHIQPGEFLVETRGGLAVGGEPMVEWSDIPVVEHTARVEILLGGSSPAQYVTPSLRDSEVVTRGGVRLAGSASPVYLSPQDIITEYTTTVSAKVGPVQVPLVEFVEPELDVDLLELTTQVALEVGGAPLVDYPELPADFEHETKFGKLRVGGACGVLWDYPEIFDHVAVGGILLAGQGEEAEEFFYYTVALHGYTFEPSIYSNFRFNSYAVHRGRVLAARDDGIYVLEGTDDDGQPIHPGVRIGPTSFGLDNYKRLRRLHIGDCGEAEVRVAGVTRGVEGYYRKHRGRYEVGREVEDKVFIVEISDFARLNQTQFDLIVLVNR